jgi:hypothetical protein
LEPALIPRRSEDIGIRAIVVTELKLCHVKWQIFCADFVERADDAAFEYRPETFNRIRVYGTDDILTLLVLDRLAWIFCQPVIDAAFIGREQADFVSNHLSHESLSVLAGHVVEHASNHVALTLNSTNDRRLAQALAAATMNFLINVLIRVLAADPRFINLDNAAKLIGVFFDQRKEAGYSWRARIEKKYWYLYYVP